MSGCQKLDEFLIRIRVIYYEESLTKPRLSWRGLFFCAVLFSAVEHVLALLGDLGLDVDHTDTDHVAGVNVFIGPDEEVMVLAGRVLGHREGKPRPTHTKDRFGLLKYHEVHSLDLLDLETRKSVVLLGKGCGEPRNKRATVQE